MIDFAGWQHHPNDIQALAQAQLAEHVKQAVAAAGGDGQGVAAWKATRPLTGCVALEVESGVVMRDFLDSLWRILMLGAAALGVLLVTLATVVAPAGCGCSRHWSSIR